jgi:hypothetical protein
MLNHEFVEKDYKLFRKKISNWQERYMQILCKEYIEILSGNDNPSKRFWYLEQRIKQDKKKSGVQLDSISRSDLLLNILSLLQEGVISFEDLNEFSDELKESIKFIKSR